MCLSESWWSFVSDAVLNGQHNKIRTYSAVFGQFFFFFIIVQRASGIRLLVWSEPAHVQFISEVNKAVLSCETSVSKTHMIRGILESCFAISQHFK